MADVKSNDGFFSSWKSFWIVLLQVMAVIILVPNDHLVNVYKNESKKIYGSYGEDIGNAIYWTSFEWYESILVETGINDHVRRIFIPESYFEDGEKEGMEAMSDTGFFYYVYQRGEALTTFILLIMQRLSQAIIWLPYVAIVFIPAGIDGYFTWKAKRYSFSYSSPWMHKWAISSVYLFSVVMVVTFFLPFAINPMILPTIAMFLAPIAAMAITSHLPKEV